MESSLSIIEKDDTVILTEDSKHYAKYKKFTFVVVTTPYRGNEKEARLLRNMRNTKMGSTNHYIVECFDNLIVKTKNIKYIEDQNRRELIGLL